MNREQQPQNSMIDSTPPLGVPLRHIWSGYGRPLVAALVMAAMLLVGLFSLPIAEGLTKNLTGFGDPSRASLSGLFAPRVVSAAPLMHTDIDLITNIEGEKTVVIGGETIAYTVTVAQ